MGPWDAKPGLRAKAKAKPFGVGKILLATWLGATNILSFSETLMATQQNYPMQGIIPVSSPNLDRALAIPGALIYSFATAAKEHYQVNLVSPDYCVGFSPTRMLGYDVQQTLGNVGVIAFLGNQFFAGSIGAAAAGVAHGLYMGVGEAFTNGNIDNYSACGMTTSEHLEGIAPPDYAKKADRLAPSIDGLAPL